ncbi:MAG: hypothetical protein V4683_17860 [Bacteroidota bacterium]
MNKLKRITSIPIIALAFFAVYWGLTNAIEKITAENAKMDDKMPWYIVLFVLLPITFGGLSIMGYYAFKGEYDESKM